VLFPAMDRPNLPKRTKALFWLCLGYLVYDDLSRKRRRVDQDGLLSRIAYVLTKVAFWASVLYLISNELSLVYCKGHTTLSHTLARFGDSLTRKGRYRTALALFKIALAWNIFWLGRTNPLLITNYTSIVTVCEILDRRREMAIYTKRLDELNYTDKKRKLAQWLKRLPYPNAGWVATLFHRLQGS